MCDMTHSYVWHDSFLYAAWLIQLCDTTHSHVWHGSFTCVTCLNDMCDMTHSPARHDSLVWFVYIIHIRVCDMTHSPYVNTYSYVWYKIFVCILKIHMCDVTHSPYIYIDVHALRTSFVWVVCITHIHMCDMTHSPIFAYIYIYMCDITHPSGSCVSHTFTCAAWLIHLYIHTYIDVHLQNTSFVWFVCITHIQMCSMTHSPICAYIYLYIYATWLIRVVRVYHARSRVRRDSLTYTYIHTYTTYECIDMYMYVCIHT